MSSRLAALLGGLVLIATATAADRGTPPKLRETCVTRSERAAAVSFKAADGVRLAGVLLGRGPRAVVLAHEYTADLCGWLPYGRSLAARGYRVLAIDLRGFGSSGQPPAQAIHGYDRDVVGAVQLLRHRGARRIVLAGASIGGGAVLVAAAALEPAVDGVISLSAPANALDVNALAAVRMLRAPVLLVQGKTDPLVAVTDARRLYRAAASHEKRLVILPSGAHGTALLVDGARARSILDAFVDAHLR